MTAEQIKTHLEPRQTWVVVYRTGGRENFHRLETVPLESKERVMEQKLEIERMGYPAMVFNYRQLRAIGLPETFDAADRVKEYVHVPPPVRLPEVAN